MARPPTTVAVDGYVLDVLLRDLIGHDKQPAAFLVYLHLHGLASRKQWRPVTASLRDIADQTGLSKSAVQNAIIILSRRELIATKRAHATATPQHQVLRPWA